MSQKILVVVIILLLGSFLFTMQNGSKNQIHGVWQIIRISTTVGARHFENVQPLPGLMLFTKGYYSMVWMPGNERLQDNAEIWHPTDQEKVAQFNAIVVNSGKYSLRDSLLITEPVVAKTPEFIGGKASYYWNLVSDTLRLQILETISRNLELDEGQQRYRTTIILERME
jgi:hypothetical protein